MINSHCIAEQKEQRNTHPFDRIHFINKTNRHTHRKKKFVTLDNNILQQQQQQHQNYNFYNK